MINILINLEFIHPASPFFRKIVELKGENTVNSKDDIRVANLTLNKVLICQSYWYIFLVNDRNAVLVDIDGNGLRDISFSDITGDWAGHVSVAFQTSLGNFQCVAISNFHGLPYGISSGDFNLDNRIDLAFASAPELRVYALINNGGWNFIEQHISTGIYYPNHVVVANLNAEPRPEVVFTDEDKRLYLYNFATNSTSIINYECKEGLSLADLNNDGRQDIVCGTSNVNISGYIKYQLNQGNSWSQMYNVSSLQRTWHGVTTGDFNKDGRVDIAACASNDDRVYVFYNNGGNPPSFTQVASVWINSDLESCELAVGDIDCDGDHDIVWAKGLYFTGPSIGYLQNPSWTNYIIESGSFDIYGVAVGYVNNDNKPDVISGLFGWFPDINDYAGRLYVYYNQCNITPIDIRENKGVNYSIVKDKDKVKILFNISLSGSIDVYSSDGSKIVSKEFSGREVNLSLKKGLYIISINSNLLTKREKLAVY